MEGGGGEHWRLAALEVVFVEALEDAGSLRRCNCRRILRFTRNPFSGEAVNEKRLILIKHRGKTKGFQSFSVFLQVKTQEGMLVRGLVWDLTRDEKPFPKDLTLTDKELDNLWADMASDEVGKAYAASRLLRADPARAVPFLRQQLTSKVPVPMPEKLYQLIAG